MYAETKKRVQNQVIQEIDSLPKCNKIFSRGTVQKVTPNKVWRLFAGKKLCGRALLFVILTILCLGAAAL